MYQKKKMMEFTIVSNEIQYIVIRNSIGWTEEMHRNGKLGTGRPLLPPIH